MSKPPSPAAAEWARHWRLPLAAALGYSTSGLHIYGIGPFIEPLQQAFGWSRTEVMSGGALVSFVVALMSLPLGALVDRIGPRRIGLIGVLLVGGAVGLLGAATGGMANWLLLWSLVALAAVPVQGVVWTSAVVTRFDAGRGLALAVTFCGASLAVFTLPLLATWLIELFDWRRAFLLLGLIWAGAAFPVLLLFFRSARDRSSGAPTGRSGDAASGLTLKEALAEPAFYKLLVATCCFAFGVFGAVVHFVPILTAGGAARMTAAGAASLVGVLSLVGRLATGAILDRFPGHLVGAITFLLPLPAIGLLLLGGAEPAAMFTAAALIGLVLGAETDVIAYVAAGRFGLKNFGALQGGLLCATAVGAALGPLAASAIFDATGGYAPFLAVTALLMAVSAVAVGTVGATKPIPARTAPQAT